MAAYTANPLLPGWQHLRTCSQSCVTTPSAPNHLAGKTVYSDSNYILLGLVLEKVTGKPADRVVTDEVIRPLRLARTVFPTTPALPRPYARGYDDSLGALRDTTFSTPAVPWTAGAIVSTAPDATRYAKLLADGALLSSRAQAQRLQFAPIGPPGPVRIGYGLGSCGSATGSGTPVRSSGTAASCSTCPNRTRPSSLWATRRPQPEPRSIPSGAAWQSTSTRTHSRLRDRPDAPKHAVARQLG